MNHDVFISYSHVQKSIADGVCHYLEENGLRCWMAPRDIPSGSEYGDLIAKAIKTCKVVVLVYSEEASNSKWVKGEINVAFSENKPIMPFRVDEAEIKGSIKLMLNQMHWIDAFPHYADKLPDLLKSIESIIGKRLNPMVDSGDSFNQQVIKDMAEFTQKDFLHKRKKVLRITFVVIAAVIAFVIWLIWHNDSSSTISEFQEPAAPVTVTEAIQLLSDSIAMDSTDAHLYLSRAKAYFANEQIGQTMVDINRSLQLDPNNVDTYLLLADVYYALGDQDNINATLNKAVEINALDARPLVKLAELNLLQQNFNLAIGYVDKALGLSPYNPQAYFVKGMCYMAAKQDTVNALKNFQLAAEQDDSFYDPVEQICRIYAVQQPPYAMDYIRKAQQQFPDIPTARYELALYLQSHGAPEEALAHYDTILMKYPLNYIALYNKGYVNYVYLEDNKAALEYFNQTLAINPNYLDAKYNKGRVLEQMGDYAQAMEIYKEVLKTQPDYQLAIDAINRIQNQVTE